MKRSGEGRFCEKCCKVVVDFTKKSAEEILDYLKNNSGTCGFFRNSQLGKKAAFAPVKISFRFKRFYLALVLVFGSMLFTTTACGGELEPYGKGGPYLDSVNYADSTARFSRQDSVKNNAVKMDSTTGPISKPH